MNPLSKTGAFIVIFALICYTVFIIAENRKKSASKTVLFFLSIGVILDITATIFMILGSSKGPFTLHGFLGYSSLAGMLIDTLLIWKLKFEQGKNAVVPRNIHIYSLIAYSWWILAFITGGLLVAIR